MDRDARVVFYNRFEEELAGRSRKTVVGKHFFKEVAPCIQVSGLDRVYAKGIGSGLSHEILFEFPRPFVDRPREVRLRLSSVKLDRETYGVLFVEDVSVVRAVERTKDFLVRTLAHDMSNPMTSIATGLELALESGDEAELRAIHSKTLSALGRMRSMVQNLYDITRLHTGEIPLHIGPSSLGDLLADVVDDNRQVAAARSVQLKVERSDQPVIAEIDTELVRRALDNLVENALRYTDSGGEIRLRARNAGQDVEIEVKDTGSGIPEALRGNISQRHFSVGGERESSTLHRGMGLAFVDLVAREHGGTVEAECPRSGGTVFTVVLPATCRSTHGD